MYYVSEKAVREFVGQKEVIDAVEAMFASMASDDAQNFPIVREDLQYANAVFGFKSGFDRTGPSLGLKAGGFWPDNARRNLANHQSTVVLFDPDSGGPLALVRGNHLTALRTAAASSISIRYLARKDARTLGIFGAGGQSAFQVRAAIGERPIEDILICDLHPEKAARLKQELSDCGLTVHVCDSQGLVEQSDVIITVTPSLKPFINASWVKPGTHIACMGSDTQGKQELDVNLVASADVFVDEPEQAFALGECQHAYSSGLIESQSVVPLGLVIAGRHPGRTAEDKITIFDSTGVGLQDVVSASLALRITQRKGAAVKLD